MLKRILLSSMMTLAVGAAIVLVYPQEPAHAYSIKKDTKTQSLTSTKKYSDSVIIDDNFTSSSTSKFEALDDPFYITWTNPGVILRYSNTNQGLKLKQPKGLIAGKYSIAAKTTYDILYAEVVDTSDNTVLAKGEIGGDNNKTLDFQTWRNVASSQIKIYNAAWSSGDVLLYKFDLIKK